ncbi:MAG: hypothetical protein ACE5JR_08715 [Gemmatimonadota bacterium]
MERVRNAIAAAGLTAAVLPLSATGLLGQEARVVGSAVSVSSGRATLELERSDGARLEIGLRNGELSIDGEVRGTYGPGGALERSWRQLIARTAILEAQEVAEAVGGWEPDAAGAAERSAATELKASVALFLSGPPAVAELPETATVAGPDGSQLAIAPGVLSFQELSLRLERLEASLARLGRQAEGAAKSLALIVHDDYTIPDGRVVSGNLALLDGELDLAGTIRGDVLVLAGTLRLEPSARVEGDVLQVGGEVSELGGRVTGELVELTLLSPEAVPLPAEARGAPEAKIGDQRADIRELREAIRSERPGFFGRVGHNIGHAFSGLFATLGFYIALGVAGLLAVYLFRPRLEVVADTVRGNFARSFGVGIAGQLLFFPILLVLVVAIVTILVIPFYLLAVALALLVGYLAVAHAAGETIALHRYRWFDRLKLRRSNSYYYTLSGLVFLLAPFALGAILHVFGGLLGVLRGLTIFAAVVFTWVALTSGFGAVILTRGGRRTEYARPATPAGDDADLYAGTGGYQGGGPGRA